MTIYDIAKEAGVSITTVSRVINNSPNVRPDTRDLIQQIMLRSNYIPSTRTHRATAKGSRLVGILTVDLRMPHYADTIVALEEELTAAGFEALVCNTGGDVEKGNEYLRTLQACGACCAILIGSVFQNKFAQTSFMDNGKDFFYILVNYEMDIKRSCSVLIDDFYAVDTVVEYLNSKGHRNIVYVQDADTQSGARKKECFLSSMKKHGLPCSTDHIFRTNRSTEGGKLALDAIMSSAISPTAVFLGDDLTAIGLISRAQELGIQIPEKLAVVGYNNSPFGRVLTPHLTTIDTKANLLASCATMLIKNMLNSKQTTRILHVRPELIIRDSA